MMFSHYDCLVFITIPPVMDVHVMLKKIKCDTSVCSKNHNQGKTECHLDKLKKKV